VNLLEAMRYLTALEHHRHFGRAAQACHITQPALSNALRALETELGAPLVRRSRQYEGLTPEGEVALAHAHRLLHGAEALRQELASLAGAPRGVLHIGAVPTAVPVAARFAARLRARHPGIRPVVQGLSSQAIDAGLESLALDLALGYVERHDVAARRLRVLAQYGERYFLVRRLAGVDTCGETTATEDAGTCDTATPGLRFGPPCSWGDAAHHALVMLTPEMHNRVIVEGALRGAGARVAPALETDSVLALLQAVQDDGAGDLAAVLPGALVSVLRSQPGLVAQALVDPVVETPIGWMTAGSTPPPRALEAALALAREPEWLAHVRLQTGTLAMECSSRATAALNPAR
jgi:DNA-binding transcriptional LysR family regulator